MHLGRRLPVTSCGLPRDGAGLPEFPCLALLHVGFTELPASPPALVGSYPTVPPLPLSGRERLPLRAAVFFLWHLPGVSSTGRYPARDPWSPDFPPPYAPECPAAVPLPRGSRCHCLPVTLLLRWRVISVDQRNVAISHIDSSCKIQNSLHPSIEYEVVASFGCKLLNRWN